MAIIIRYTFSPSSLGCFTAVFKRQHFVTITPIKESHSLPISRKKVRVDFCLGQLCVWMKMEFKYVSINNYLV